MKTNNAMVKTKRLVQMADRLWSMEEKNEKRDRI